MKWNIRYTIWWNWWREGVNVWREKERAHWKFVHQHTLSSAWEYKNRWERILIVRAERGGCNRCVLKSNCEMMMEKPFQRKQCVSESAGQSSGKQCALTEPFLETYSQLSKVINLTHTNEDILIYLSSQWLSHPFIHHEMCGEMVQGHLATHTILVKDVRWPINLEQTKRKAVLSFPMSYLALHRTFSLRSHSQGYFNNN